MRTAEQIRNGEIWSDDRTETRHNSKFKYSKCEGKIRRAAGVMYFGMENNGKLAKTGSWRETRCAEINSCFRFGQIGATLVQVRSWWILAGARGKLVELVFGIREQVLRQCWRDQYETSKWMVEVASPAPHFFYRSMRLSPRPGWILYKEFDDPSYRSKRGCRCCCEWWLNRVWCTWWWLRPGWGCNWGGILWMLPWGGTMGSFRSMKEEVILLAAPVPVAPLVVAEDVVVRSFPNGENVEPPA